jgi:hypothetical protein
MPVLCLFVPVSVVPPNFESEFKKRARIARLQLQDQPPTPLRHRIAPAITQETDDRHTHHHTSIYLSQPCSSSSATAPRKRSDTSSSPCLSGRTSNPARAVAAGEHKAGGVRRVAQWVQAVESANRWMRYGPVASSQWSVSSQLELVVWVLLVLLPSSPVPSPPTTCAGSLRQDHVTHHTPLLQPE